MEEKGLKKGAKITLLWNLNFMPVKLKSDAYGISISLACVFRCPEFV